MRSSDTTSSPCMATAPPDRPVRPPEGTRDTSAPMAQRTRDCTSSTLSGRATANGAGGYCRVQSRP